MNPPVFHHVDGKLYAEGIAADVLAERFGTPLFVYSRAALTHAYHAYIHACAGHCAAVHVAVKANSNLGVLNVFARLGAGFDIVSGGELARVLAAHGKAEDIVFSGVGKREDEMRAALQAGVKCFNVESIPELTQLNSVAASLGKKAPVALRVNPDVDPKTHPYISTGLKTNKFGIAFNEARAAYQTAAGLPWLDTIGIDCHIGSQITTLSPYLDAVDKILDLVEHIEADGITLAHIDVGGGLGITYADETPPAIDTYVRAILSHISARGHGHRTVFFEPGRSLTGNAGILLTRVELLKSGTEKNFAIVDAAMNDLARPAMYQAFHAIEPAVPRHNCKPAMYDIVGPVCESSDWLGCERMLAIQPGDLLAIHSAGAYGFVMSSNYNSRPRAAEVLVDDSNAYLVRPRETIERLFADEMILPETPQR